MKPLSNTLGKRSRILYGLALGCILVCVSVYSLQIIGAKASEDISMNIKDLPERGIRIISPTDAQFDNLLEDFLHNHSKQQNRPEISTDIIRAFSVFMQNTGQENVVGYWLIWELTNIEGKTVSHVKTFLNGSYIAQSRGKTAGPEIGRDQFVVKPNEFQFVSLLPISEESSGAIYSGNKSKDYRGHYDDQRLAASNRDSARAIDLLIKELKETVSIIVSVDGAFFEDGLYVGPNKTNFFERVHAQYEAKRDLYAKIQRIIRGKERPEKVSGFLNEIADARWSDTSARATASDHYEFFKKLYARELSRTYQQGGAEALIELVDSRLATEWVALRKE